MKNERDYIQDIAEIRSMMERSSKFLSLSGWAGIMAGIYALAGTYIAWRLFGFNPKEVVYTGVSSAQLLQVILLAVVVLVFAIGTAVYDAFRKAGIRKEKAWNATSKRLLGNMAVPLITGGIFVLIVAGKGLTGLVIPLTLLFYGLALYSAGRFTYNEVRVLGLAEILLGLISSLFIQYSLIIWAAGFGLAHIIYGLYMFYRYER